MVTDELTLGGGGEGGGKKLRLSRSELIAFRKLNTQYDITDEQRQTMLGIVVNIATAEDASPRNKLAAAKTFVSMDKLNADGLKTYVDTKMALADKSGNENSGVAVQVNIIERLKVPDSIEEPTETNTVQLPLMNGNGNGHHNGNGKH